MNERIKQLYVQAIQYADSVVPKHDRYNDIYYAIVSGKHAELIVEECMAMCDTVSADYLKHRKAAFDFQDKNIYAEGEAACDILKFKMKNTFRS
jgi:hypothetical protein